MDYSDKLKALRGKAKQQDVADAVGISVSAYRKYENGERRPNDEIKIKLAKYFNTDVSYIFFSQATRNV